MHIFTQTQIQKHTDAYTHTNNEFGSSEWLSRRNWSHIVSFTLVNWAVCPLHAVLSFLFPPFPITLILFSSLLFMGSNMLLSNFQLNW